MKLIFTFLRRVVLLGSGILLKINLSYHLRRIFFGFAIRSINGSMMFLDLKNDVGISKDLFIFGKREHVTTDFLIRERVINDKEVILDIGANIGYYALLESRLTGSSGIVYALEPVSNNYRLLIKNIEINNVKNIKAFKLAAGQKSGEDYIFVANKGNISSFVFNDQVSYTKKEKVKVVRIDDFVREKNITPTMIRMDVEGYEKEIVKGMVSTLLKTPKLLIEMHPHIMKEPELVEMFSIIEQSGYTKAVVIKERNELWMKKNGSVKPVLLFLTEKIEGINNALGIGKLEVMNLGELQKTLDKRKSAFHVLLS
ncbi:MAG: FkbM family methyltransferase [Candidatus Vogelbacteria bacterium]